MSRLTFAMIQYTKQTFTDTERHTLAHHTDAQTH